jgi:hypothetical protein
MILNDWLKVISVLKLWKGGNADDVMGWKSRNKWKRLEPKYLKCNFVGSSKLYSCRIKSHPSVMRGLIIDLLKTVVWIFTLVSLNSHLSSNCSKNLATKKGLISLSS